MRGFIFGGKKIKLPPIVRLAPPRGAALICVQESSAMLRISPHTSFPEDPFNNEADMDTDQEHFSNESQSVRMFPPARSAVKKRGMKRGAPCGFPSFFDP